MRKTAPIRLKIEKMCDRCRQLKMVKTTARFCDPCKEESQAISRISRLEYTRKYRLTDEYRRHRNIQIKIKLANNPKLLLAKRLRNRIYVFIRNKGEVKLRSTKQMIGCSYDALKKHIESQFINGMSWDNIGKWHIDHEKPLSSAVDEKELIALNHYTNLRPLWAIDNLKKGSKYNGTVYQKRVC